MRYSPSYIVNLTKGVVDSACRPIHAADRLVSLMHLYLLYSWFVLCAQVSARRRLEVVIFRRNIASLLASGGANRRRELRLDLGSQKSNHYKRSRSSDVGHLVKH